MSLSKNHCKVAAECRQSIRGKLVQYLWNFPQILLQNAPKVSSYIATYTALLDYALTPAMAVVTKDIRTGFIGLE